MGVAKSSGRNIPICFGGLRLALARIWWAGGGCLCLAASLSTLVSPSNLPCGFCYHHYMERLRRTRQLYTISSSHVSASVLGMLMVLKSSKYPYHGLSRFCTLLTLSCMLCIRSYKRSHETKLGMRAANFLVDGGRRLRSLMWSSSIFGINSNGSSH